MIKMMKGDILLEWWGFLKMNVREACRMVLSETSLRPTAANEINQSMRQGDEDAILAARALVVLAGYRYSPQVKTILERNADFDAAFSRFRSQ